MKTVFVVCEYVPYEGFSEPLAAFSTRQEAEDCIAYNELLYSKKFPKSVYPPEYDCFETKVDTSPEKVLF